MFNAAKEIEEIRAIHTDREYASDDLNIDHLVDRYRQSSLPNECIYFIDCRTTEVLSVTDNEDKVLGIKGFKLRDLTCLYEHTTLHFEEIIQYTKKLLSSALESSSGITFDDMFSSTYQANNGATVYKRTALLERDSEGNSLYTIGSLMNASGIIPAPQKLQSQFFGPNKEKFYAKVNGIAEFQHLLSPRELEILFLIKEGFKSEQIGKKLFLSRHTVDTHRRNIISKLEAANSFDAIKKAQDFGLIA